MKTLLLVTVGLLTFAAAGNAAPGGGMVGVASGTTATASTGNARPAPAAPAAHMASGPTSANHAASINTTSGFRSINPASGYPRSFAGSTAGVSTRSPGFAISPGAPVRAVPTMPTVRNAWSDPVNPHVAANGRSVQVNNQHAGQNLYAGAYGYTANRPANGRPDRDHTGHDGFRRYHRYYYNNFPYPVYYPYYYGGIGYGGPVGDYAGLTADNSVADLGAPDFSAVSNGYYSYAEPTENAPNPALYAAPAQPLPDTPAVGPQNPSATAKSSQGTIPQGPDSLVEAVQDELGKRGYFAGKPDAVYNDATKESIRRFQSDQQLPATGRINEATLHALHLD